MPTINGRPIREGVHELLVDDSDLYHNQTESGGSEVFIGRDLGETFFTFVDVVAVARDHHTRHVNKYATVYQLMVWENNSPIQTFLSTLSLRDLYELTELLNFIMSKSIVFTEKRIEDLIMSNPFILAGIGNYLEDRQKPPTVLSRHEERYIQWAYGFLITTPEGGGEVYNFRFTDGVWILLKIRLFSYSVNTTMGCSFLSMGVFALLSRLEAKTDAETMMLNYPEIVTKVEMMNENMRQADHDVFSFMNCRLTYTNGSTYEGQVVIHPIVGPVRQGHGRRIGADNVIFEEGKYILDEIHSLIQADDCECQLCECEDFDEEEEHLICLFSFEREDWDFSVDLNTSNMKFPYCEACSHELLRHERRLEGVLAPLLPGIDTRHRTTSVKAIKTYEEYTQYLLKYEAP